MLDVIIALTDNMEGKYAVIVLIGLLFFLGARTKEAEPYYSVKYLKTAYWCAAISCEGLAVFWLFGEKGGYWQTPVCGALCVPIAGTLVFSLYEYGRNSRLLRKAKSLEQRDIIGAWRQLKDISLSGLTPGQKKTYYHRAIAQLVALGDIGKAEVFFQKLEETDTPLYHMFQGIRYLVAGDLEKSLSEMKAAEDRSLADTEPYLQIQILMNHGVMQVCHKNFQEADYYLNRARELALREKAENLEILEPLYYNYIFNRSRLEGSGQGPTWQQALEEYKGLLDLEDPLAFNSVCNMELELMRQTKADVQEMEKMIFESFEKTLHMELTDQQRCIYEGTMARIVCTMRLDPRSCLAAIEKDWLEILQLPMPARYRTLKEIDLLFRDLGDDGLLQKYSGLDSDVEQYMMSMAETDLSKYRNELPEEAVYERAYCLREMAGLRKNDIDHYHFGEVRDMLMEVIASYKENELELEALDTRLAIMDESIFLLNLTDHFKPVYRDEMLRQLEAVEMQLEKIATHPKSAECALRLSYYTYHLDDYERCIFYFDKYETSGISIMHFAPWLRRYYEGCSVIVRMLRFARAIDRVRDKQGKLETYDEGIRKWFRDFPQSDGLHGSYLLGRYMGYEKVPVKIKIWYDDSVGEQRNHAWFCEQRTMMDVDLTYGQFREDRDAGSILFVSGHHPMEINDSAHRRLITREKLPEETGRMLDAVYQIILDEVNSKIL